MRLIAFFCFLCLLSCQTRPSSKPISPKSSYLLQIAQSNLSRCRYPQALLDMKKALSTDINSPIINHAIGVVYFFMKKYNLAQKHLIKAIERKKTYTEARVSLAQVWMKKKKWKIALTQLKMAEKDLTYFGHSKTYSLIGEIYYHQKKYRLAKKYFLSAFSIDKNNCAVPAYLGRIHYDLKEYEKALVQFKINSKCERKQIHSYANCENKNVDHYYFQGASELRSGQIQQGLKTIKKFIQKSSPDSAYIKFAHQLLETYRLQ